MTAYPHDLTIGKFEAYGLTKNSLKLSLHQLVTRTKSPCENVKRGVPQGSILRPLLFNAFINDLFRFIENCEICKFADNNRII